MFHPLFRVLVTRPHLVFDHLGAYGQLIGAQIGEGLALLKSRALLVGIVAASIVLGTGLLGIALMLLAVIPLDLMPMPWLLAAVPLAPWLVAAAAWLALRGISKPWSTRLLREQLDADTALFREAGER